MKLTRRRFLAVAAAGLVGSDASAAAVNRHRFIALGALAEITLPGPSARSERAVDAVRAEVARIEAAFSLWKRDSELSRLNRQGILAGPSPLFRNLAKRAREMSRLTDGAFDVTVQPVWQALRSGRPSDATIDYRRLEVGSEAARFISPGMGASFNGIAQGFATDRAIEILQQRGYRDVLANLGEFRGLGRHPSGRRWLVGIESPVSGQMMAGVMPGEGAVATSEPGGTLVAGRPHIFDPLDRPGPRWASVTVQAGDATAADALSTAVAASPTVQAEQMLHAGGAKLAVLIAQNGAVTRWRAKL